MLNETVLILAGITMLYYGGDILVNGSIHIAQHFKISPFVIGATVIGFGTSLPELAVSVFASIKGASAVALGNAIGSNITNICLVLGLTSLFGVMPISKKIFRTETPSFLFVTLLITTLAWDHEVSRSEGIFFLILMIGYLWLAFTKKKDEERVDFQKNELIKQSRIEFQIIRVVGGLSILVLGAHLLVTGAVSIARSHGISEWLIGITIVAVGTSLPEIVSSIIASFRGHHEMSIGNIYGSNIFNIILVVGVAATIHPLQIKESIYIDLIVTTFLTFLLIFQKRLNLTILI